MAKMELVMPKMGESIMEATILKWNKKPGDKVSEDETILEIATDKVDSEIPSPVDGIIKEILFKENDVVEIGKVIAYIEVEGEESAAEDVFQAAPKEAPVASIGQSNGASTTPTKIEEPVPFIPETGAPKIAAYSGTTNRFYSPLVKNIATTEQISIEELEGIPGSGKDGRVTKKDMLRYLQSRSQPEVKQINPQGAVQTKPATATKTISANSGDEILQMDRMRKLIAEHMVRSKHTSPHVTSFVEADVTNLVNWRNKVKGDFAQKHGQKITFTPIFIDAIVKAIKDFPMINISLDGDNIIVKKDINIGMAAALPSGNLIVPVIKNADNLNMVGLTKAVNDLAHRARENKLSPNDIQGGTFTLTNVGTFGNVMGTPIINQPQVAIMAAGAIRKKPAVVETKYGDVIAIRHMMFLSLSYDHRIVDGFLGGSFLRKVADYLEAFNTEQSI